MDFINSIPAEVWWGLASLLIGVFGTKFAGRDPRLDKAIKIAQLVLDTLSPPNTEMSKAAARTEVVNKVRDQLRANGFDRGAENLARLALEQIVRKGKK